MKKQKYYFRLTTIFFFIFVLSACNGSSSFPALTAAPPPTSLSTPLPLVAQWASGALADSVLVGQTIGRPNTLRCGTISTMGDAKVLDVYFDQPVVPSSINIHMTEEMPADIVIQLLDADGKSHSVDFLFDQIITECPFVYKTAIENYGEPIAGIRISAANGFLEDWDAIDAIELVGIPAGSPVDLASSILKKTPTPVPTSTPTPAPLGQRSYYDRTDDYAGKYQVHVVYALFDGDKDLNRDTDGSIARSVQLANDWFSGQTDGSSLRFDTYQGELDVTFVKFEIKAREALEKYRADYDINHVKDNSVIEDYYMDYIIDELLERDFYQKGKYYIFYIEHQHPHACGFSLHSGFPGVFFLKMKDCGYGRLGVDAYAWNTEFVILHEALHGLGFTPECAPHNVKDNPNHVNDSSVDLMFSYANADQQLFLDLGHDDYYKHGIEGCPDLANSVFLEPLPDNPEVPKGWPLDFLLDK
ncbi:MAG TPA: hypothetical protein VFI68_11020 [Anaerolineales bacterium]|nr:hypothetical protein [Anaerolineales bacterium]